MTKTERQLKSAANKMQDLAVLLRNIEYSPVLPILSQVEGAQLALANVRTRLAGIGTTVDLVAECGEEMANGPYRAANRKAS